MRAAQSADKAAWANISGDTIRPVVEVLKQHEFVTEVEGAIVATPGSCERFNIANAARFLIFNSVQYGASTVARSFLDIFDNRRIRTIEVRSIAGLKVTEKIQIQENIWLVEPSEIPDVENRAIVFSPTNTEGHYFSFPPSSALVIERVVDLKFWAASDDEWVDYPLPVAPETERVPDILSALVLASEAVPEFRDSFNVILDVGWPGLLSNGRGGSYAFPKNIPFDRPISKMELLSAYLFVSERGKIEVGDAIEKLKSARCRASNEEKVIDYGTFLEMLLTRGDNSTGEISLRIAMRAAWLLGETFAERKAYFDLAKKVYSLRSRAVHDGTLQNDKKFKDLSYDQKNAFFKEVDYFCCEIALEVMKRKAFPKWDSLTLGLGAASFGA